MFKKNFWKSLLKVSTSLTCLQLVNLFQVVFLFSQGTEVTRQCLPWFIPFWTFLLFTDSLQEIHNFCAAPARELAAEERSHFVLRPQDSSLYHFAQLLKEIFPFYFSGLCFFIHSENCLIFKLMVRSFSFCKQYLFQAVFFGAQFANIIAKISKKTQWGQEETYFPRFRRRWI